MDWLDADEEHRRTFDRERQMYNALLLFAPQKQVAFRQSIGLRRIIGYAAQIAAMLALAVGIGWGYVSYHEHSWEALTTRISAPEGQRVNLKLQDGTEVWLNSGAELEYPSLLPGILAGFGWPVKHFRCQPRCQQAVCRRNFCVPG